MKWIMMKVFGLFSLLVAVEAATQIAVLEFGKGGTVRRTDASASFPATTVEGVTSFWNALHRGRRLQHAGMPVVADLFRKADVGLVLGLSGSGVDLDHMPVTSSLFDTDNSAVSGHMEVEGMHCGKLLSKVDGVETVPASSPFTAVKEALHKQAGKNGGVSGVQMTVDASNLATVDSEMSALFEDLQSIAESSGKTIVLHLVVEEERGANRRRLLSSRRLEDEAAGENQNQQQNQQQQQNAEGEQNNNANNGQEYSGYYGYGYYNAYGEWVTPYKTMFQIQYFNVVLWTALGLIATLFFVIYLMLYMPLEPDTLLFGESAKLVGSE
jgi:hypothetical protein